MIKRKLKNLQKRKKSLINPPILPLQEIETFPDKDNRDPRNRIIRAKDSQKGRNRLQTNSTIKLISTILRNRRKKKDRAKNAIVSEIFIGPFSSNM